DELVVAADEREQLAAVAPEHIEVAEGISHVSNVARAVLRHLRILVDADGAPVEVQVMLVPVELRDPEEERSRPVQRRQVRAALEPEPDALAILVAWAVPDHVDRPRLQRGEAIGGGRGRGAADVGRRAEVADRKSTRLNSSHGSISYAVFCLK